MYNIQNMIWGKYFWTTMHVAALGFPEFVTDAIREKYKGFYKSLGYVLPCSKCRGHYTRHFDALPIDLYLYDKNTLFTWTVDLHNIVNIETGKKEWTVQEAKEYYISGKYDRPEKETHASKYADVLILLCIVLMIILICIIIWLMSKPPRRLDF